MGCACVRACGREQNGSLARVHTEFIYVFDLYVHMFVLSCQAETRAVTGPDCEIDRTTGSWARDGFGSINWTVRALELSKQPDHTLFSLKMPVSVFMCVRECMCECLQPACVRPFVSLLMTLHSASVDDKAWMWFMLSVERTPWLRFSFVAVNCFWQAVLRPHASPLTALALVSVMLHLLFISSLKSWLY